jgi:hypothetical protein
MAGVTQGRRSVNGSRLRVYHLPRRDGLPTGHKDPAIDEPLDF